MFHAILTIQIECKAIKHKSTGCEHSPTFGSHLERRREARLEVGLEGNRHLCTIHQDFDLNFGFSYVTTSMGRISSISTCRERAPRWYKRRQLDYLGLLGVPATDGLVLEDERILY